MEVLLVEENPHILTELEVWMSRWGHNTVSVCFPGQFPDDPDIFENIGLVIMDPVMSDRQLPSDWKEDFHLTGVALMEHFCTNHDVPVMFHTGLPSFDVGGFLDQAVRRLVARGHRVTTVCKPCGPEDIKSAISFLSSDE